MVGTKGLPEQLLTEAGYPNGFKTKLNCPNDRYINDEQTCVAIASMWAKVGIQAASLLAGLVGWALLRFTPSAVNPGEWGESPVVARQGK